MKPRPLPSSGPPGIGRVQRNCQTHQKTQLTLSFYSLVVCLGTRHKVPVRDCLNNKSRWLLGNDTQNLTSCLHIHTHNLSLQCHFHPSSILCSTTTSPISNSSAQKQAATRLTTGHQNRQQGRSEEVGVGAKQDQSCFQMSLQLGTVTFQSMFIWK